MSNKYWIKFCFPSWNFMNDPLNKLLTDYDLDLVAGTLFKGQIKVIFILVTPVWYGNGFYDSKLHFTWKFITALLHDIRDIYYVHVKWNLLSNRLSKIGGSWLSNYVYPI